MAANLEDQLIEKVRALPSNKQQEALDYLDTLVTEGLNDDATDKLLYQTTSAEEWIEAFRKWASSHPTFPVTADDSRESIYQGRGE